VTQVIQKNNYQNGKYSGIVKEKQNRIQKSVRHQAVDLPQAILAQKNADENQASAEFDQKILQRQLGLASPTFAAQKKKTQNRHHLKPSECPVAKETNRTTFE
jgi:hypothetical protein